MYIYICKSYPGIHKAHDSFEGLSLIPGPSGAGRVDLIIIINHRQWSPTLYGRDLTSHMMDIECRPTNFFVADIFFFFPFTFTDGIINSDHMFWTRKGLPFFFLFWRENALNTHKNIELDFLPDKARFEGFSWPFEGFSWPFAGILKQRDKVPLSSDPISFAIIILWNTPVRVCQW